MTYHFKICKKVTNLTNILGALIFVLHASVGKLFSQ